jgi:hypothetical protein
MTAAEKKLIVYLLRRASDEFSNHGCNDLELVRDVGLTPKESFEIRTAMHEWEKTQDDATGRSILGQDPPPSEKNHYTDDWFAMLFAAAKIEEL